MMDLEGLDIEINRGDAAGLTLHFEGDDAPEDGTDVIFWVRPIEHCRDVVISKTIRTLDKQIVIDFTPGDTEYIEPGEYYWNACIQYANWEEPWTLLRNWAKFIVLP